MSPNGGAWQRLVSGLNSVFELPPLEGILIPSSELMQELLPSSLSWLVAPPKCGKSVLSYFVAYLLTLGQQQDAANRIVSFDGAPECARGLDLVIEAPYGRDLHVAIFENPFGTEATRPSPLFARQLRKLINDRPHLTVIVTSRPDPFLANEKEIRSLGGVITPMGLSDWYPVGYLRSYLATRGKHDISPRLLEHLASPALIDDYINHDVEPQTTQQRQDLKRQLRANANDIALDKFAALRSRSELATAATLMRLQEYAPSVPSASDISSLIGTDLLRHPHLSLLARPYEFDGAVRLRFEHAVAREAADLLLSEQRATGFNDLRALAQRFPSAHWISRAIGLWEGERLLAASDWPAFSELPEDVRLSLAPKAIELAEDLDQ